MRFLKKNNLYHIIIFLFCVNTYNAQTPIHPTLLLKSTGPTDTDYHFYSFENQTLSLFQITEESEYTKIWEYRFIEEKNVEIVSTLFGDISGNGEKELILIIHVFGQTGEIYIFPTDNNQPTQKPEIYSLGAHNKGSKPSLAKLLRWDEDKDKEVIVSFSSPDRKVVVFDYSNNQLKPQEQIAQEFLETTYGPIKIDVLDINKDGTDDIVIFSNSKNLEEYIVLSNATNQTKRIEQTNNFIDIATFKYKKTQHQIGITQKGELYSILTERHILNGETNYTKIIPINNQTLFILDNSGNIYEVDLNIKAHTIKTTQTMPLPFAKTDLNNIIHVVNQAHQTLLFSNPIKEEIFLLKAKNPIEIKRVLPTDKRTQTPQAEKKPQEHTTTDKTETKTSKTRQPEQEQTQHDTLFINVEDKLELDVITDNEYTIQSLETTKRPEGILLDPETLMFTWKPQTADIGTHNFEYVVNYTTASRLQSTTTENQQLALNSISEQKTHTHTYTLFVNDIPQLIFDNPKDTIYVPGSFITNYSIQDKYKRTPYQIKVLKPNQNKLLIGEETIYWEPDPANFGNNEFILLLNDGIAQDTATIFVYVDTTTKTVNYNKDFIATVNKEFTQRLPYETGQKYKILQGPTNMRITQEGEIYWIPLVTEIGYNHIEIEINKNKQNEKHQIDIYVNYPPVISYRPALKEHITHKDTFRFQLQSYDMNQDAQLQWKITNNDTLMKLNNIGLLTMPTDSIIDNISYQIILDDGIDEDRFLGKVYINDIPKIINTPRDYIELGTEFSYKIEVEDNNEEQPFFPREPNTTKFNLTHSPKGAIISAQGEITWVPNTNQIGKNVFNVLVGDPITEINYEFSVFVNDRPNIVSVDSLSIMVGDTLVHYFNAEDLNSDSDLTYSIKTTIEEMLFGGTAGKLTWMPTQKDIGLHALEISVSDGFNMSTDKQKLQIFVYEPPTLKNKPPSEAFVNIEYLYKPEGRDMFNDSIINKDIFVSVDIPDSTTKDDYNQQNNEFKWTPALQDLGEHAINILLIDKYNHSTKKKFNLHVLLSPCETADTLIIHNVDTVRQTIIDTLIMTRQEIPATKESPKEEKPNKQKQNWHKYSIKKRKQEKETSIEE